MNRYRITALICALVLALTLSGCGAAPEPQHTDVQSGGIGELAQAGVASAAGQLLRSRIGGTQSRLRERLVDVSQAESATVMIYLVGSDLESASGLATDDLEEMMRADLGEHVNLVIQTMGCHKWHNDYVSPTSAQRFTVEDGTLACQQDNLGQLDSTEASTLQDFITYCSEEYPADRNILIFWDHGGGPVYGFGYDEYRSASSALTLDEIRSALAGAGVRFDFIGFDACLMGCLETCYALYDYADYLICSEDFTSGFGFEYQYWLTELGDDVSVDTQVLGKTIVDTFITESELAGSWGVLALVDLQYVPALFSAWTAFAYANEEALTQANYSWQTENTGRGYFSDWSEAGEPETTMQDYYVTDLLALSTALDTMESAILITALRGAVVYSASTEEDSAFTGLAVTLPYGDTSFYADLERVFLGCGLDGDYVAWLECFTTAAGSDQFYDGWDKWTSQWDNSSYYGGWNSLEEDEDYGGFYYDEGSQLYYYVYSDGDIQYYVAQADAYYYYDCSGETWAVWSDRADDWVDAEDPGFSTQLENPG